MCGVVGIARHPEAANLAYLGLHALQHRGQESAGIVVCDRDIERAHRAMGLVQDVFTEERLEGLSGEVAIGHVRYSTAGASLLRNAQPFSVQFHGGALAIAHNGNFTNAEALRAELENAGSIFQSATDTEVLVHLLAREKGEDLVAKVIHALSRVEGAYSLVILVNDTLIAVRDPFGLRPLSLGILPSKTGAYVLASEPVAFDLIGAEFVRDVAPGELIVIDREGLRSVRLPEVREARPCVFEHVYFARPDSRLDGRSVYGARKSLGAQLAKEAPVEADVVIPVPDSGVASAIGFAQALGIPLELGLIRSHYVGRTFIEPQQSIRHFGVRLKLNPVREVLAGKRVVILDDSIVRGTTSRKIVKMVRDAGAREVHLRIASPPVKWPCYYGIDTPTRSELIASSHSVDEIARYVTADSLAYLSIEGMLAAVAGDHPREFCDACFSGNYPIAVRSDARHLPIAH